MKTPTPVGLAKILSSSSTLSAKKPSSYPQFPKLITPFTKKLDFDASFDSFSSTNKSKASILNKTAFSIKNQFEKKKQEDPKVNEKILNETSGNSDEYLKRILSCCLLSLNCLYQYLLFLLFFFFFFIALLLYCL